MVPATSASVTRTQSVVAPLLSKISQEPCSAKALSRNDEERWIDVKQGRQSMRPTPTHHPVLKLQLLLLCCCARAGHARSFDGDPQQVYHSYFTCSPPKSTEVVLGNVSVGFVDVSNERVAYAESW